MFGFRFFNTSKEPEKLIPFTIGKGENRTADEIRPSASRPSRIRSAFLDARFARIKRNKPADETYVKPVTESQYRLDESGDNRHSSQQEELSELQNFETDPQQDQAQDEEFNEEASIKLVRYSKALRSNGSRFNLQNQGRINTIASPITLPNSETRVAEAIHSTETTQLNLQSDNSEIEQITTGKGLHTQDQSLTDQKAEVVSYRPKPLITRLTKQRNQRTKSANTIKQDRDASLFSSMFSIEKDAFGSTISKTATPETHKWPQPSKSFTQTPFLNSMGTESNSPLNSVANAIASSIKKGTNSISAASSMSAITAQRQVSIKDLTDAPNFMRSEETKITLNNNTYRWNEGVLQDLQNPNFHPGEKFQPKKT